MTDEKFNKQENLEINNNSENGEKKPNGKKKRVIIPVTLAVISAVAGFYYYIHSTTFVSTDDAFIEGHSVQVSPKIQGNVIKVYIDDNQKVQKGQLLAEIDPVDYQVKYEQAVSSVEGAEAQKNASEKQISQSESNLEQINAEIASAKAELNFAQAQLDRYTSLYLTKAASKQDLDRITTNYQSAKAKLDSLIKKAAASQNRFP